VTICVLTVWVASLLFAFVIHEIHGFWGPVRYDYDVALSSPDGRYTVMVMRGDASAIDDFSYRVFVFPRTVAPTGMTKGKVLHRTGIWDDPRYLVYVGYAVPCFRWTSSHELDRFG
jgi:hypothetical protein